MNKKNDEIKIEEPQSTLPPEKPLEASEADEIAESVGEAPPEKLGKTEPGKTKKFFRKALTWLVVIVIAFGAGFLLDHFLRYRPLLEDLQQTQAEQAKLQGDLDVLDNSLEQMTPKLEAANAKVASLEGDLEMANARLQFYKVLVNVSNARLSLFLENIEEAQVALADTEKGLEALGPVIEKVDAELALSMPRRLELIIAGLERDPETAAIDLELFTKDLLALEPMLFDE